MSERCSSWDGDLSFCREAFVYWPGGTGDEPGVFIFALSVLQLIVVLIILIYLCRQSTKATQGEIGEKEAARTLIFPLYARVLWMVAAVIVLEASMNLWLPYTLSAPNPLGVSCAHGISTGLYHTVFEGVAFLLMSAGAGRRATDRAALWSCCWGLLTAALFTMKFYFGGSDGALVLQVLWGIFLVVLYATLWLLPSHVLFRRPALYKYAAFWCVAHIIQLSASVLRYYNCNLGFCVYELSPTGFFRAVTPYIVYRALLRDSQYWQGVLAFRMPGGTIDIRQPLLGITLDHDSARAIATTMSDDRGLGMRGSFGGGSLGPMGSGADSNVRILNFAFLKILSMADEYSSNREKHVVLGAGSDSRIFKGTFREEPVAIKMVFCPDLTPQVVHKFYHEASMLTRLRHPNVVELVGVCVLPPSICLVMELCNGGNLHDYLRSHPDLSWAERLKLARDCAKAVAFLHSQDPPILHLDLKCMNFLLSADPATGELVVKVADLELSREVVIAKEESKEARKRRLTTSASQRSESVAYELLDEDDAPRKGDKSQEEQKSADADDGDDKETLVTGSALSGFTVPETVNWLAPEIIRQQPYDDKADVYALSMCLFEIATGGKVPFDDRKRELKRQARAVEEERERARKEQRRQHILQLQNGKSPLAQEQQEQDGGRPNSARRPLPPSGSSTEWFAAVGSPARSYTPPPMGQTPTPREMVSPLAGALGVTQSVGSIHPGDGLPGSPFTPPSAMPRSGSRSGRTMSAGDLEGRTASGDSISQLVTPRKVFVPRPVPGSASAAKARVQRLASRAIDSLEGRPGGAPSGIGGNVSTTSGGGGGEGRGSMMGGQSSGRRNNRNRTAAMREIVEQAASLERQLRRCIVEEQYRPSLPDDTPAQLAQLVRQAWDPIPRLRPTAKDMCQAVHAISVDGLQAVDWLATQRADELFDKVASESLAVGTMPNSEYFKNY